MRKILNITNGESVVSIMKEASILAVKMDYLEPLSKY